MDRRSFIRLSTVGAVAAGASGIIAPTSVLASSSHASMAGGMYYTKDAPGRWSKKVGGHLPLVAVSGKNIEVTTPHAMKAHGHYIVKHMILNEKFDFIDEKVFDPTKDKRAVSEYSLDGYNGRVHVLSVCNLHDTWLNIVEV